jgi:hypothetical protein
MSRPLATVLIALASLTCLPAQAGFISYEITDLGGANYRYDYTITNDGSITTQIGLFDILFDPALYDEASLFNVSDPSLEADWSQMFLGSGIGVPAAFDAFANGSGIGVGGSVSGFAVQFSWLGTGSPGAQTFEIYDPETFELLGGGTSTLQLPPVTAVPEPGTFALMTLSLAMLALQRRRARWARLKAA